MNQPYPVENARRLAVGQHEQGSGRSLGGISPGGEPWVYPPHSWQMIPGSESQQATPTILAPLVSSPSLPSSWVVMAAFRSRACVAPIIEMDVRSAGAVNPRFTGPVGNTLLPSLNSRGLPALGSAWTRSLAWMYSPLNWKSPSFSDTMVSISLKFCTPPQA